MEGLLLDLRQSARTLLRDPTFLIVAVVTLGVGVAANLTVFGIVEALVLRPLPYEQPERLVHVAERTPEGHEFPVSDPNFLDFQRRSRTLESLAAWRPMRLTLDAGAPERVEAAAVSANFAGTLGRQPARGRWFTAEEDRPGAAASVAVIGERLAARNFAGDPVGRTVRLDGGTYTIVGVMPASFRLRDEELWVPLAANAAADRDNHWLDLVGRLAPGASIESATRELSAISAELGRLHPEMAGWSVIADELDAWLLGPTVGRASWILLGAVAFLLLLAGANVANLLLVRGIARRGEVAVRAALGAGRLRLLRHLLMEGALLAIAGSGLGLLLAAWALDGLRALEMPGLPSFETVALGPATVAVAIGLALLLGAVFGTVPVLQAARLDLRSALRGAGGRTTDGKRWGAREALIVVQVALAVVLLVGSGLLVRSFVRLQGVDPGYETRDVLSVPIELPQGTYGEPGQRAVFVRQALDRLAQVSGVKAAGAATLEPLSDSRFVNDVTPLDRAALTPSGGLLLADWRGAWPGYFEVIGLPLLAGRVFTEQDSEPVVVLTRSLADRLWPGEQAVGKQLYWGGTDGEPYRVVGVVGDLRDFELDEPPPPLMFVPMERVLFPAMTLVVRTAPGAAASVAPAVRSALQELDAGLAIPQVGPLERNRKRALAEPRLNALLLAAFSSVALLLAALGIYAVMAFTVALRRRELAIRVALGADTGSVSALVVRRALTLAALGIVAGGLAASVLARFLEGLLYEIQPTDLITHGAVPVVLLVVALVAAWLPARRAGRVRPIEILRHD